VTDGRVWIVSEVGDPVAARLPASLERRGLAATTTPVERLGDLRVTLAGDRFRVEGETVAAIVFRAGPLAPTSASFDTDDRGFCDAETRALWLGALHLPSVRSFNRLDAVAWFESEHWTVWRRLLAAFGVARTRCEFGGSRTRVEKRWLPFAACALQPDPGDAVARATGAGRFAAQHFARHLVACGRIVRGPGGASIVRAVHALALAGVALAEIVTDAAGDVACVDSFPRIDGDRECDAVCAALADEIAGRPA
jgi:hypothetical protein